MVFKPSQTRRTFSDVVAFQNEIKSILERKIRLNTYLTRDEIEKFNEIYPWVLLSHGSSKFYFKTDSGSIIEFSHITEFIENLMLLSKKKPEYLILYDEVLNRKVKVSWRDVWTALLQEIIYLEPYVREEAIHMSAEAPIREEATAFKFSLDKKID